MTVDIIIKSEMCHDLPIKFNYGFSVLGIAMETIGAHTSLFVYKLLTLTVVKDPT